MGRKLFSEGSRADFLCTQLYYMWFDRVLDGGPYVIVSCYNESRYKTGWKPLLYANLLLQKNHLIRYELCLKKYLSA